VTYALIDALVRRHEEVAKNYRTTGGNDPTNPRATAMLETFLHKLHADPAAGAIPLEALVTPASLSVWREIFRNPEQLETAVADLRCLGMSTPRVRPESDRSLLIALPWCPDQDEPLTIAEDSDLLVPYAARLVLVNRPDDWRVSGINGWSEVG
jgi:hypothetical protein